MNQGLKTIIYPVKDIAQAKALYTKLLGVEPTIDQPYYVGYSLAGQDIALDPNGHKKGLTGPVSYWHVTDLKQSMQQLLDAGSQVQQDVQDVGGGKLVAIVKDPDGNSIGLIQPS
ncbi:MAG TPA: VOC family protein [Ktedonobacteraceae bacterium]|nr:VOC family protein [Ktedonobacteraceae bacterium]